MGIPLVIERIFVNKFYFLTVLATSVILIGGTPPSPLGIIVFIVFIPLFYLIEREKTTLKNCFYWGFFTGVIWNSGTLYWIAWATFPGFLGTVLYLPLYFGVFCFVQKWLFDKWGKAGFFAAPILWTGLEIIQAKGIFGFTWQSLAYTQTFNLRFIQFADVTGMYGVTFWVVLINVLMYFFITGIKKQKIYFAVSIVVLFVIPLLYGIYSVRKFTSNQDRDVNVSIVQGNIDPYKKWIPSFVDSNYVIYRQLSFEIEEKDKDLLVWPETAMPFYIRFRYNRLKQVREIVDSLNVNLLTGAPDYYWDNKGSGRPLNSAFLLKRGINKLSSYSKIHLVPFSEFVPFKDKFPFFENFLKKLNLDVGDFAAGDSIVVFSLVTKKNDSKVKFSTAICFDSIFPYLIRKFFINGAQFLVIITNDGWFGRTSGPYQHQRIAVLRAIENRSWIVRCANTGISCFIDPVGNIVKSTKLNEAATLTENISKLKTNSFFTKHGLIFPEIILIISVLILIVAAAPIKGREELK
ncbi:apolipoprotein N-acyltransferase [candidate division KSB1 bacterium]|nr:MAG: apolipoprotein N-acyltransferase [candidate division KSB1 bacterium]